MKNIYKILLILSVSMLTFTSCEDWLDKKDPSSSPITEDDVFADETKIFSYSMRLYDAFGWWFDGIYTVGDRIREYNDGSSYHVKDYANTGVISGEVMSYRELNNTTRLIPGDWQPMVDYDSGGLVNDFSVTWAACWEVITVSSIMIDRIPDVASTILTTAEKNQYMGEAYAFRAMAYYELMRRWGAVPFFEEKMTALVDVDIAPTPVVEIAQHISDDCDRAVEYLDVIVYGLDDANLGRIGKPAPMALKSLIWTTAASPLFNTDNDLELWGKAAQAAWDVIALSEENSTELALYQPDGILNPYKSGQTYSEIEGNSVATYNRIFYGGDGTTVEACWPRWYAAQDYYAWHTSYAWVRKSKTTSDSSIPAYSPTQEVVDRFEMDNGLPWDHADSGYDPDQPYKGRDQRFYANIWYHGSNCIKMSTSDITIDMRYEEAESDMNNSPYSGSNDGNSNTGYLIKKLQPQQCNWSAYITTQYYKNNPRIRMAEMYLNYAEAMNEWKQDPSATLDGATLSAVEALDVLRARMGHVPVHSEYRTDYLKFQDRVRNEFAVELCFERHLTLDLTRWKIAKEYLNDNMFTGMLVRDDSSKPDGVSYTRFELPPITRVFEDKHYLYPFPTNEIKMLNNLEQNPGW